MMKIVIAGTNGFAQFIAYYLRQTTSHNMVLLSRRSNQGLQNQGWQVIPVSYQNKASLAYSLRGTDIVISTISGHPQLCLIEAAAEAQVRMFIPSAFSGPQQCSPRASEKPEWEAALRRLSYHEARSSMRYSIFTFGIFYERFGPGGLARSQISAPSNPNSGIGAEGQFLVNYRTGTARLPTSSDNREAHICLTGARDAARYVVAAIQTMPNISSWPHEFRIRTERVSISTLTSIFARVRGTSLATSTYTASSLANALTFAHAVRDLEKEQRLEQLIAAAEGSFDFAANLSGQVLLDSRATGAANHNGAERFETWLKRVWH